MVDKRDPKKEIPPVSEERYSHSENVEDVPSAQREPQARSRLLEDTSVVESRHVLAQIQTPKVLLREIATLVARNRAYETSTFGVSATAGGGMYCTEELAGENDQEGLLEEAASNFAYTIVVPSCQFGKDHSTTLFGDEMRCDTDTELVAQRDGGPSGTEEISTASQEHRSPADSLAPMCLSSRGSPAIFDEEEGVHHSAILVANGQNKERVQTVQNLRVENAENVAREEDCSHHEEGIPADSRGRCRTSTLESFNGEETIRRFASGRDSHSVVLENESRHAKV